MKSTNRKYLLVFLLLTAAATWTWFSRAEADAVSSGKIPAPRQGFLAPGIKLSNANGEVVTLEDYRGQPVVVNFWASWCGPCRYEMPAFVRIYSQYKDQGLVVLAVNATFQDDPAQAAAFVEKNGLTFPILFDAKGEASRAYEIQAFPSTFFINREGVIKKVIVGGMPESLLHISIDDLLSDPPQESP